MVVQSAIQVTEEDRSIRDENIISFKLEYYGAVNADRRYIPALFPWLANSVIKKNNIRNVDVQISNSTINVLNLNDSKTIVKYSLGSIYRLSRLKHCKLENFFAYLSLGATELSPSRFHIFSSSSDLKKAEFLKTLKSKVLGFQKITNPASDGSLLNISPPKPTHRRGVSSGAILVAAKSSDAVFRDSVFYIGRVTISQPQAPPKFIDEVLVQFQRMHTSQLTFKSKQGGTGSTKNFSFDDMSGLSVKFHKGNKSEETSTGNVHEPLGRRRSASCNSDNYKESDEYEEENCEADITLNNIQEEVQSRLVTLQISKTSLMLFSVGSKMLLLEKKINNISFCTKGEGRSDHFGFICKEGGSHICYIFQGESEQKVDAIMKSMKLAFSEALEASAHLKLCDFCPLQFVHNLCTKLEGASSVYEKKNILEEGMKYFTEYEQLHIMNKVNEVTDGDEMEQVEVTVNSMREIIDQKQKAHKHTHKLQNLLGGDVDNRDRSKSSTIFEKAKKSFTSSIQSFSANKKPPNGRPYALSHHNSLDSGGKPRSRSVNSSSSCPVTPDFSSHRNEFIFSQEALRRSSRSSSIEEVAKSIPQIVPEQEDEIREIHVAKKRDALTRKTSWRQAIYHSVVTPSRRSSASSIITISGVEEEKHKVNPSDRAKARWKSAIMNQILLIRMEKENKKLAANISATETRRQKLSYQELASYSAESAKTWDNILRYKSNERVDDHILSEAIRGGIPKARRGEVWQFLMKQNAIRMPATKENQEWKREAYRTILTKNTSHQHAILIDLGRTFPTHAHFIPRLGSGQLGLFNVLKAYSILDDEVGYCQGISFVAGIMLMHLSEEDAFKSFCHIMFNRTIRNQYKPDMYAVQQQLYQLSRLLHDYHPVLYEHFNTHDVTPTLYAAPWFLTLYASQYPVGFVSRVMDLVFFEGLEIIFKIALVLIGKHIDEILNCDSFESIVDYMKITLPEKVVNETDEICTRALDMDIKQKLNLYEVEYQLLKEEMIDIRQNKEKLEKQEHEQKQLENEVKQLRIELHNATKTILTLQGSLELSNQMNDEHEEQIRSLKAERDMLSLTLSKNIPHQNGTQSSSIDENEYKKDWELVCSDQLSSNGSLISISDCNDVTETSLDTLMSPDYTDSFEIPKIDDVISIKSTTSSIGSADVLIPIKNENF